jgi:hypothetical protein
MVDISSIWYTTPESIGRHGLRPCFLSQICTGFLDLEVYYLVF